MNSITNPNHKPEGIVLSLYDLSGVMVRPWAEAGFECFIVDVQHPKGCTRHPDMPNVWRWGGDILNWLPPKVDYRMAFSFSPCDDTAVSGARWFVQKGLASLAHSIEMFARGIDICQWSGAPWCAEHPVSTISSYFRKADRSFHPWQFDGYTEEDDNYTKLTNIWHSPDFVWPDVRPSATRPDPKRIWHCPPSADRKNLRSKTPDGFARAVFLANTGRQAAGAVRTSDLFMAN
jgi:hypothetical protein